MKRSRSAGRGGLVNGNGRRRRDGTEVVSQARGVVLGGDTHADQRSAGYRQTRRRRPGPPAAACPKPGPAPEVTGRAGGGKAVMAGPGRAVGETRVRTAADGGRVLPAFPGGRDNPAGIQDQGMGYPAQCPQSAQGPGDGGEGPASHFWRPGAQSHSSWATVPPVMVTLAAAEPSGSHTV